MLKKILTYGGLAFVVFFMAYRPAAAADVLKGLGGIIAQIGNGFAELLSRLAS